MENTKTARQAVERFERFTRRCERADERLINQRYIGKRQLRLKIYKYIVERYGQFHADNFMRKVLRNIFV